MDAESLDKEEQTTVRQVAYYNRESSKMLAFLMLAVLVLLVFIGLLIATQLFSKPEPKYFSLNNNNQIIEPLPLDQEGITKAGLLNWVNELVIAAFSYNYSNQDRQEEKLTDYLSDTAMDAYKRLLVTDEDLSAVKDMSYVVSVKPTAAPEILVSRSFRGRYAWQIRIPATVRFSNALVRQVQRATIEFLVLRVPETESPLGIKVAGFTYKVNSRGSRENVRR